MVRGRRVRAFITVKENDGLDSPKRKDQRLDFSDKLSQVVSPKHLVKTQTITDFFHVVQDDTKVSNFVTESLLDACLARENYLNEQNIKNNDDTVLDKIPEEPKSLTPHRIELCPENQRSPTTALSKLHIVCPKKTGTNKARRRLNTTNNNNNKDVLKVKEDSNKNHTLTEYFPVRRSVRKTKRTVLEEKQKSIEDMVRNKIEDGLEVRHIEGKGRGVIAAQAFSRGDFVVEYYGELIDMSEARSREQRYALDHNTGCYMYYFRHKNQQHCIDATAESGRLGRLVNHSRSGNLVTRTVSVDGLPRLVLIAREDIRPGEELTYDYGDRSRDSLKYHPWLAS